MPLLIKAKLWIISERRNDNTEKEVKGTRLLLGYLGIFLMLTGVLILVPLIAIPFYPTEEVQVAYFLVPGLAAVTLGFFLFLFIQGKPRGKLEGHQDITLIVLVWIMAILVSAVPFMLTGKYNFTQAVFESTSGYTTTGLSVVDVSTCPHVFLFYRSFLQFVGGVGLVLILTSAVSDRQGMALYLLEGHNDRLLPNLIKSARLIFAIYFLYMVIGVGLYLCCGLSLFESVCQSMSALSTGGFSTRAGSIAAFNSLPVEIVTMILMLLGSTNFVVHYYLLRGKFFKAFRHYEFGVFLLLLCTIYPIMVISLFLQYQNFWLGVRYGTFEFVSAITTSGFQVVKSYKTVPSATFYSILILMCIGGQSGSTSGGIKQSRIALFLLNLKWYLEGQSKGSRVIRSHYIHRFGEKELLEDSEVKSATDYVALYGLLLLIGTFVISLTGVPFNEAFFEFASSLGTVGLSIGVTSFSSSPVILWTEIVGMFLGRLEILVVFVLAMKVFKVDLGGRHSHEENAD